MNGKKAAAETPRYYHTDHRGMTILYEAYGNLYINLTNRCPCACEFCERKLFDHIGSNGTLWLSHEPTAEEVKAALDQKDLSRYGEVVFCGFGEPTEALPVLLETADELKRRGAGNVRINTNGLGNLVNRRDITPEFEGRIDTVSISLNTPDADAYLRLVHPRFGKGSFEALVEFAKGCTRFVPHVILTTVERTITKEQEAQCASLCLSVGAEYRIRPLES